MNAARIPLDELCINTVRSLAIDAIQKANSGHPGMPLGAAPMAYVLWQNHLKFDPECPSWPDRDRFVLSAGHGSMLLYAMLHLTGYDLTMEDLRAFRQLGSRTPGHPEFGLTPGVEATTGPLGQGCANAVGMAIAERALAHRFNRPGFTVVDHCTYAMVSDGDLMEGIAAEAASLAGHLRLGKLIYLYDANAISLDGPTSLTFTEEVGQRYRAYGWQVLEVTHGDSDLTALEQALTAARADTTRPSLIIVHTTIGYGSPNKQGSSAAHGAPLGADEVKLTKAKLGLDPEQSFVVPPEVSKHMRQAGSRGGAARRAWLQLFAAYEQAHPELATAWGQTDAEIMFPADWESSLPDWPVGEKLATRQASGKLINALAARAPWLIGGDADLSCSTNTAIAGAGSFEGAAGSGRNVHFGVREHAMAAVANGICYHGGLRPFVATFFVFADYMRPALRLAALNRLPVIYVWTHDSVAVGEDGPTHQPIEHLMSLRVMPGFTLIRPADATETMHAWRLAMQQKQGPVGLVLTRQAVPTLDRQRWGAAAGTARGAYVLADPEGALAAQRPRLIVIATGSEVHLALQAMALLQAENVPVRVVSMPSWEIFLAQEATYQSQVLPPDITARVAVEAGVTFGWQRFVGSQGAVVGIDRFGTSAPGPTVMEHLGLTAAHVVATAKAVLANSTPPPHPPTHGHSSSKKQSG